MFYKAHILVTLKSGVKDAKARILEQIIKRKEIAQTPVCACAEFYTIEIDAANLICAKEKFNKIADEILANPVIENFEILSVISGTETFAGIYDEQDKSGDCCLSGNKL